MRAYDQVVRLRASGEHTAHLRGAHGRQPRELAPAVVREVEVAVRVARRRQRRRQRARRGAGGNRPRPGGQHLHVQVDRPARSVVRVGTVRNAFGCFCGCLECALCFLCVFGGRVRRLAPEKRRDVAVPPIRGSSREVLPEQRHGVARDAHVVEHALDLARVLVPALRLEAHDERLLGVVGRAPPEQQALGEVLLVVPLEHVLLLQEAEQRRRAVEDALRLLLGDALQTFAQLVVHVQRQELGRPRVQVHERLERRARRVDESAIRPKRLRRRRVQPPLQGEQRLHVPRGVRVQVGVVHQLLALLQRVIGEHTLHERQPALHARVQLVRQRRLLDAALRQHRAQA